MHFSSNVTSGSTCTRKWRQIWRSIWEIGPFVDKSTRFVGIGQAVGLVLVVSPKKWLIFLSSFLYDRLFPISLQFLTVDKYCQMKDWNRFCWMRSIIWTCDWNRIRIVHWWHVLRTVLAKTSLNRQSLYNFVTVGSFIYQQSSIYASIHPGAHPPTGWPVHLLFLEFTYLCIFNASLN